MKRGVHFIEKVIAVTILTMAQNTATKKSLLCINAAINTRQRKLKSVFRINFLF